MSSGVVADDSAAVTSWSLRRRSARCAFSASRRSRSRALRMRSIALAHCRAIVTRNARSSSESSRAPGNANTMPPSAPSPVASGKHATARSLAPAWRSRSAESGNRAAYSSKLGNHSGVPDATARASGVSADSGKRRYCGPGAAPDDCNSSSVSPSSSHKAPVAPPSAATPSSTITRATSSIVGASVARSVTSWRRRMRVASGRSAVAIAASRRRARRDRRAAVPARPLEPAAISPARPGLSAPARRRRSAATRAAARPRAPDRCGRVPRAPRRSTRGTARPRHPTAS